MYKPIVQAVIGITIALGASGCAQYPSQPSGLRATPSATRTNRMVVAHSMAFYRLSDGKIVEERAQLDMLGLLQQFGAVPGEVRP